MRILLASPLIFCLFFAVCATFADSGFAQNSSVVENAQIQKARLNIAGRQRMLSQRMASAACLTITRAQPGHFEGISTAAHDEFASNLRALVEGDAARGWPAETDPDVLAAFAIVREEWEGLSPAIQQLIAHDYPQVVVQQLLDGNLRLLRKSNAAVLELVRVYGGGDDDGDDFAALMRKKKSNTINIAGRQRMLSQKMMKEACLLAAGVAADQQKENLAGSMALFATSLGHLRNGSAEDLIVAPSTPELVDALETVQMHWDDYSEMLAQQEPSQIGDGNLLRSLAELADHVLRNSHKAVQLYANAGNS